MESGPMRMRQNRSHEGFPSLNIRTSLSSWIHHWMQHSYTQNSQHLSSLLTMSSVMKFNFLDSFPAFTILSFLAGLIILILFLTDYLSYPHLLTNFMPRRGTKNNQTWDYVQSANSNKSTVQSTSTEDPESLGSYQVGLAANHLTASRSASSASKI